MPLRLRSSVAVLLLVIAAGVMALLVAGRFFGKDVPFEDLLPLAARADRHEFPVPDSQAAAPGAPALAPVPPASDQAPHNVILVVADGMGLGELSAASALIRGPAGGLAVEHAPVVGLVRTWAADALVTDSAAAASAMATGLKTPKGAISTQADGSTPPTLFEAAAAAGMATGFVTTSGLVDATPAAFLAHAAHRSEYRTILEQMRTCDAAVLIGGDWRAYPNALRQPGYLELMRDAESHAAGRFTVVRDAAALAGAEPPLLALFPPRPGSRTAHGPPLAESTRAALALLGAPAAGFLLVVEHEETDEAAHDNDVDGVVAAMAELDEAIRVVLEVAAARGDTLVVVAADHDTAGMAVAHGDFDDGIAELRWLNDGHLGTWVPLFAFGPGATRFAGVLDNTDIARRLAELMGFEGFPPSS
jgi:alkaline phosphatase